MITDAHRQAGRQHGQIDIYLPDYLPPHAVGRVLCQASPIHAHHPASAKHGEADGHLDAVLYDVQLAAPDLVPVDGDLGDLDAGGAADNSAV